ncbi:MAG: hypothetical protein ACHQ02_07545 [Candidatus Limnocylindrales bacterium]|jgi:ABC-type sugar transport system substrate-binding protein
MSDDMRLRALRATAAARLLAMQVPGFAIDRWCAAWEAEARRRDVEIDADSWNDGIAWIVSKIADGESPPS